MDTSGLLRPLAQVGHPGRMPPAPSTPSDRPGTLAAVGVDSFDEEVYRRLLTVTSATPAGIADELGWGVDRTDRALERLRAHGLASRMSGRTRRYAAVEPDAALEALVRSRVADLEQVRSTAVELSSAFHAVQRPDAKGVIELLDGPQELGRWFVRLQHGVREEMLVLDRPPYALAASNPVEPVSLAQGVRWRAIYAPEALEQPGAIEEIETLARSGEQGRVLADLPMKLAIADRRLALLPLSLDIASSPAVLIHESTLLDALVDLFEGYWERAIPIGEGHERPELSEDDRTLVTLMAGGLTDTAIARQLGWSTRTMRRRTRRVFEALGASNRFQAGIQASRRGWL